MKIPPIATQGIIASYEKQRVYNTPAMKSEMRPDALEISQDAASFSEVFRAVKQAVEQEPEAAKAHKADLLKSIAQETYQISSREIARSILRGVSMDKED